MLTSFWSWIRTLLAAAALKIEDSAKQATYESISFQEIQAEINELKVLWLVGCFLFQETTLLNKQSGQKSYSFYEK